MPTEPRITRVWDLPTRVFHWSLALCVICLFITGKIGGDAMLWHSRLGYAVGTLLLFRVTWGLVGGHWSRFRSFIYSPRAVVAYLRGTAGKDASVGHSPLGAGSVFALLGFLLAQVATGLFSDDRADFTGPLNVLVSNQTAKVLTAYHKEFGEVILIGLVVLHLAAVAFYQLRKKQNLVGPMWHGDKALDFGATASRDDARSRIMAIVLLGLCAGAVAWLVSLGNA